MNSSELQDVARIAGDALGRQIASVQRFNTGLGNRVYDVLTTKGDAVVLRIMASRDESAAAVHWSKMLRPLGVPLPELLAHHLADDDTDHSWMLLQRLPGQDLEQCYSSLSIEEKRAVLDHVLRAQSIVGTLPSSGGFGYALMPGQAPMATWREVILSDLDRSRRRIIEIGAIDVKHVDAVQRRLDQFEGYFGLVRPVAFLDDTTTKNVIVHEGQFQGIVDVDMICYGDSLFVPALTRMSLLGSGFDTSYADLWLERSSLTAVQRRAFEFYTAMFCVNFLSELGQRSNQDVAQAIDPPKVSRLLDILQQLLDGVDSLGTGQ